MREQINFSLSNEFRTFMGELGRLESAQSVIHGIFIDLHPLWKRIVNFESITGLDDRIVDYYGPFGPNIIPSSLIMPDAVGPFDPEYMPDSWKAICHRSRKMHTPFVVKIYVLPTTRDILPQRRIVQNYARQQPFFTVVLDAPMPLLAASVVGGTEITATGPGTLGGFLQDQSGKHWGITCGHVAQNVNQNISLDDIGGTPIVNAGTVKFTNFNQLVPQNIGDVCNQYVDQTHLSVDAALVEISPSHTASGTVRSMAGQVDKEYNRTNLNSGSTVTMVGALSGKNDYVIGGYGVTSKIMTSTGQHYCFSNLFEFYALSNGPHWMPGRVVQALAPRPLQGDSGSWLCYNYSPNHYAYFGNMIAVMGAMGIATFADALIDWAQHDCKLSLKPL